MQPDAARVEETRLRLAKMEADLRAALVDMDADPPLLEDAMFHCQQADEKALKGFLTWHDQPFRKTHSLVELGGQVTSIDSSLGPLLQRVAGLSEYATVYRYPGETAAATPEEASNARGLACEVREAVLAVLPSDVR